jgi:hypothetical protein
MQKTLNSSAFHKSINIKHLCTIINSFKQACILVFVNASLVSSSHRYHSLQAIIFKTPFKPKVICHPILFWS